MGGGGVINFPVFYRGALQHWDHQRGEGYKIFAYDIRISHPTLGYK
jgi:hypothetical protein